MTKIYVHWAGERWVDFAFATGFSLEFINGEHGKGHFGCYDSNLHIAYSLPLTH